MPFEPKIIPAGDLHLTGDGEIDLPDDCAALGEQLRDDALHLASCYPATPSPPRLKAPANRRYRWTIVALCGPIAAASLLTFAVFPFQEQDVRERRSGDRSEQLENSAFVSATPPAETASLSELSQPELEALLDLMERHPTAATRVSF